MATPYISRDDALALSLSSVPRRSSRWRPSSRVAMQTFKKQADHHLAGEDQPAGQLPDREVAGSDGTGRCGHRAEAHHRRWRGKPSDMFIEEAATIAVFPENVLADSEVNLLDEVKARCSEAIAVLIDKTCLFGCVHHGRPDPVDLPGRWSGRPGDRGQSRLQWGTTDPDEDLAAAWSEAMALVEADGYDVTEPTPTGASGPTSATCGTRTARCSTPRRFRGRSRWTPSTACRSLRARRVSGTRPRRSH